MIRNIVCIIISAFVLMFSSGCGNNVEKNAINNKQTGVEDVLQQKMAEEDNKPDSVNGVSSQSISANEVSSQAQSSDSISKKTSSGKKSDKSGKNAIDIDLTTLSSTMVYSEVYNMVNSPESYKGKIVKMKGLFAVYKDKKKKKNYYGCIISDATACCSQGIEFEVVDGYTYPDDYPEEGYDICVVGTFDSYQEDGYNYCILRKAKIL